MMARFPMSGFNESTLNTAPEIWMAESIYPLVHGKIEKPVRRELDIRLKGKDKTINALVYKPLQY